MSAEETNDLLRESNDLVTEKEITPPKEATKTVDMTVVKSEAMGAIDNATPTTASTSLVQRRTLAEVESKSLDWLLRGMLLRGHLNLVAGVGGLGKSTYLCAVAARLSRGELDGGPASTLIISAEDTAEEALKPRIEAAGGVLDLVHELYVTTEEGGIVAAHMRTAPLRCS
jgi:predicted ATP-dependent serine protease